jgi:excinuclease ABC subunit C
MNKKSKPFYPGDIPAKPGVYIYRDRFGKVIYVGKAANLRKRMSQYFQPSRDKRSDPKVRSLMKSIADWEFYVVKNEDESLILESRLIKQYAPRYNVLMRDDKRFLLIKINLNEELPRLRLARVRKDDNARYFGPFPKSGTLRPMVDFISRHFGIRMCRSALPDENDHKHCLASIVKDCCEPCVGKVSREEYMQRVNSMMRVLEGNVKELLEELKKRMMDSAEKKRYEKAAQWRDIISGLEEVFGAKNRSFKFASIASSPGNEAVWDLKKALKIETMPEIIEGFDISNIGGEMAVASMVCFEKGKPGRKNYRRFKIRDVHQIDDFAMMKEVIRRRYGRLIRENKKFPDLIMVDGGKGQLHAAIEALDELKCEPLPIIGLAKKNEEIFIPGKSEPLVLDRHRPALRLLQALRDEAHRFAVSYHRELRAKRLQESLLDEIPGIGPSRKKALLTAFGSVSKLRHAGVSDIIDKVPGIGESFAQTVCDFLKKNKN